MHDGTGYMYLICRAPWPTRQTGVCFVSLSRQPLRAALLLFLVEQVISGAKEESKKQPTLACQPVRTVGRWWMITETPDPADFVFAAAQGRPSAVPPTDLRPPVLLASWCCVSLVSAACRRATLERGKMGVFGVRCFEIRLAVRAVAVGGSDPEAPPPPTNRCW